MHYNYTIKDLANYIAKYGVDRNSCVVCSLAVAMNVTYEKAYNICASYGRIKNSGMSTGIVYKMFDNLGFIREDKMPFNYITVLNRRNDVNWLPASGENITLSGNIALKDETTFYYDAMQLKTPYIFLLSGGDKKGHAIGVNNGVVSDYQNELDPNMWIVGVFRYPNLIERLTKKVCNLFA